MTNAATPGPHAGQTWRPPTSREMRDLLKESKTIAIVGVSADPTRPSNTVAQYLRDNSDYTLWFVNPRLESLFGEPVYASLADLPGTPDIVDVFRRPSELPQIGADALAIGAKALWLQLGLYNTAVAEQGVTAGQLVVMDKCLKIEHEALLD